MRWYDDRLSRLVDQTPLKVLSGDDNQNFVALRLGAHGTIAAPAHVLPGVHLRILELLRAGQTEAARRLSGLAADHPLLV